VLSFTGSVVFDRLSPAVFGGADGVYARGFGGHTLTASGIDISGPTGCRMSGAEGFTIPPRGLSDPSR
jgi:hypothetical protein